MLINMAKKASVFFIEKVSSPTSSRFRGSSIRAMMIDKKGVDEVIDILQPGGFSKKVTN